MHKDLDGKVSLARSAYIATLVSVLLKMLLSGFELTIGGTPFTVEEADLTGMALILASTAATYYGSEKSKREQLK